MNGEPVVWRTAIAGLVAALASAGLLTSDQAANINGAVQVLVPLVAFLLPLVAGFLARRKVTPVRTAPTRPVTGEHRKVERASVLPPPQSEQPKDH